MIPWPDRNRMLWGLALMLVLLAEAGCAAPHVPSLLLSLPERYNTPDGMRLDPRTGDIILACPNFGDPRHPGALVKITRDNRLEHFFDMPVHPDTGRSGPMGLDFGPDGHLYVADNQYFYDRNYRSRLIRVRMENGRAVGHDIVVEGFRLANAVMWKGDVVYVSETFFDLPEKPGMSGIYRFTLAELNAGPVKLKPKDRSDPHLIAVFETDRSRRGELAGADGITFDSRGALYTGIFGDGAIYRVSFNADGTVCRNELFVCDEKMSCADGIFCDLRTDEIYVADSQRNAIHVISRDGRLRTLWENPDTDGSRGLLDQPCEVLIRGNELIVANFDYPVGRLKNRAFDSPHTISVIRLR